MECFLKRVNDGDMPLILLSKFRNYDSEFQQSQLFWDQYFLILKYVFS